MPLAAELVIRISGEESDYQNQMGQQQLQYGHRKQRTSRYACTAGSLLYPRPLKLNAGLQ